MKIEEAIRILDPDTTTEALAEYEYFGGFRGRETKIAAYEEAIEVARAALRARQNPAKLDRDKLEGCDKCTVEWDFDDLDEWNNGTLGEVRIGKGEMMCDVGVVWHITPIRFCPFCGHPLTEEAWAELERRIGGNDGTTH